MRTARSLTIAVVFVVSLFSSPAQASCVGVMCGGVCGVEGLDFCVYVWGGNETIGCKNVGTSGCMSMGSLLCCPRDPMG